MTPKTKRGYFTEHMFSLLSWRCIFLLCQKVILLVAGWVKEVYASQAKRSAANNTVISHLFLCAEHLNTLSLLLSLSSLFFLLLA